jgi:hypothetical protein
MKDIIFVAVAIAAVIFIAERYRKEYVPIENTFENGRPWDVNNIPMERGESPEELDDILGRILGSCFEAYCEDCDDVLAVGTGPYEQQVANIVYTHREIFDHETYIRNWAE